jgi:hypothetical protein
MNGTWMNRMSVMNGPLNQRVDQHDGSAPLSLRMGGGEVWS